MSSGYLIAFEGLDQSGKQTQAERLVAALRERSIETHVLSFPDYATAIGAEIGRALQGGCKYTPEVMQLLFIANRYEHRPAVERWIAGGSVVICDRYLASSVAYGEAQGLDGAWLTAMQTHLPQPALTLLLDITPEASLARKQLARDRYERDLALLGRVRDSYLRQASRPPDARIGHERSSWVRIDGSEDKDAVTGTVQDAVRSRLGLL